MLNDATMDKFSQIIDWIASMHLIHQLVERTYSCAVLSTRNVFMFLGKVQAPWWTVFVGGIRSIAKGPKEPWWNSGWPYCCFTPENRQELSGHSRENFSSEWHPEKISFCTKPTKCSEGIGGEAWPFIPHGVWENSGSLLWGDGLVSKWRRDQKHQPFGEGA